MLCRRYVIYSDFGVANNVKNVETACFVEVSSFFCAKTAFQFTKNDNSLAVF